MAAGMEVKQSDSNNRIGQGRAGKDRKYEQTGLLNGYWFVDITYLPAHCLTPAPTGPALPGTVNI